MAFVPVSYSNGVPVLASDGVTPRVACVHLAEWLQVYDALQVARGRGHVTYYQTMGGADASAGTHLCGSAWDMAYTGDAPIMDAREMGAADWPRLHSLGWPANLGEHVHGLISCGDNSCNAYQYTAYWLGCNGLGLNGQGGTDPLPKPSQRRTWQDGIAWAKAEIARLTTTTEDDMAYKEIKVSTSGGGPAEQILGSWDGLVGPFATGEEEECVKVLATAVDQQQINARQRDVALAWRNRISGVNAILAADADAKAIAAQLAASLPKATAQEVVTELSQKLGA